MTTTAAHITITKNHSNTLFVYVDGEQVADSMTWRRARGFWNKKTQEWTPAPGFTPRKVKADPSMVLVLLGLTGFEVSGPVSVQF